MRKHYILTAFFLIAGSISAIAQCYYKGPDGKIYKQEEGGCSGPWAYDYTHRNGVKHTYGPSKDYDHVVQSQQSTKKEVEHNLTLTPLSEGGSGWGVDVVYVSPVYSVGTFSNPDNETERIAIRELLSSGDNLVKEWYDKLKDALRKLRRDESNFNPYENVGDILAEYTGLLGNAVVKIDKLKRELVSFNNNNTKDAFENIKLIMDEARSAINQYESEVPAYNNALREIKEEKTKKEVEEKKKESEEKEKKRQGEEQIKRDLEARKEMKLEKLREQRDEAILKNGEKTRAAIQEYGNFLGGLAQQIERTENEKAEREQEQQAKIAEVYRIAAEQQQAQVANFLNSGVGIGYHATDQWSEWKSLPGSAIVKARFKYLARLGACYWQLQNNGTEQVLLKYTVQTADGITVNKKLLLASGQVSRTDYQYANAVILNVLSETIK